MTAALMDVSVTDDGMLLECHGCNTTWTHRVGDDESLEQFGQRCAAFHMRHLVEVHSDLVPAATLAVLRKKLAEVGS